MTQWKYFFLFFTGTDRSQELFVGDVTTQILHNLEPGTTYDVKVFAQYDAGMSGPLAGQGTTCMYNYIHMTMTLKLWNFYCNIHT